MSLNDAVVNLRLPYTYEIVEEDLTKRKMQQMIGSKASEIAEKLRDHFIDGAIEQWRKYRESENEAIGIGAGLQESVTGSVPTPAQEGIEVRQGTTYDSGVPSCFANFERRFEKRT